MAKKITKTNAVRLLSQAKIAYNLVCYEVDPDNLAATHVAELLNQNPAQIFKTLVLSGDKTGHLVCIIPANKELNTKLAAKASGNKNIEMIPLKELLPTTGYIRGACSPIGMKKHLTTYIDSTCQEFDTIFISAGVRGMQIEISPLDLVNFIEAQLIALT